MKQVVTVFIAALCISAFAQGDLEARVAELEQRIAQLEAVLSVPAPPTTTQAVDGFTFTRLNVRQTAIGLELVGEVTSSTDYDSATFRLTFYADDGEILETQTFSVRQLGASPRTFDSGMFSDVSVDDIFSVALQVERTR